MSSNFIFNILKCFRLPKISFDDNFDSAIFYFNCSPFFTLVWVNWMSALSGKTSLILHHVLITLILLKRKMNICYCKQTSYVREIEIFQSIGRWKGKFIKLIFEARLCLDLDFGQFSYIFILIDWIDINFSFSHLC